MSQWDKVLSRILSGQADHNIRFEDLRMYKYRITIYWSEADQAFIAEVPELPGAMADGPTPEEAAANARETIRLWIEYAREHGRAIPEPQLEITNA